LPQWTLPVVFGLSAVAGIVALVLAPAWLHPALTESELRGVADAEKRITLQQKQSELQNNARATLLQGLAGLVVVAGAAATWQQVRIARHGHITDRITKAVDQLGEDTVDVRLGGLYALERVAQDSYEDRATVTAILVAFVRTHAPADSQAADPDVWLGIRAPDVQAALTLLARRPETADEPEIYLSRTDLRKARMVEGRWDGMICAHSNLAGARMRHSSLVGVAFDHSDLREAHFCEANLAGAKLRDTRLDGADLHGADLRGADLTGATLDGADLTGVRTDAHTIWPNGFNPATSAR
jgi:hypothetical protein